MGGKDACSSEKLPRHVRINRSQQSDAVSIGGLHGLFLVLERWLRSKFGAAAWTRTQMAQLGFALVTYGLVCLTWVFFRASSFSDAALILQAMAGLRPDQFPTSTGDVMSVILITVAVLIGHRLLRDTTLEDAWAARSTMVRGLVLALMIIAIILSPGADRAFIYFQF